MSDLKWGTTKNPVRIGKGSFGCVYNKFKCLTPPLYKNQRYISKLMKNYADGEEELQKYQTLGLHRIDPMMDYFIGSPERCALSPRETGHILKIGKETCTMNLEPPLYVLNYVYGGRNLEDVLEDPRIDPILILRAFVNIFDGLELLHSFGVYHLDIKESNMVLSAEGVLKLIDFGGSRTAKDPPTDFSGSILYAPFERHFLKKNFSQGFFEMVMIPMLLPMLRPLGLEFTRDQVPPAEYFNTLPQEAKYVKSDIWSLGITLQRAFYPYFAELGGVGLKLQGLIRRLLAFRIEKRPGAGGAQRMYRTFARALK